MYISLHTPAQSFHPETMFSSKVLPSMEVLPSCDRIISMSNTEICLLTAYKRFLLSVPVPPFPNQFTLPVTHTAHACTIPSFLHKQMSSSLHPPVKSCPPRTLYSRKRPILQHLMKSCPAMTQYRVLSMNNKRNFNCIQNYIIHKYPHVL